MSESYYSINEIAEMFGVNVWTVRLWADRFKVLHPFRDSGGNIVFAPDDVERIEMICRLTKTEGMTFDCVRKHLESQRADG